MKLITCILVAGLVGCARRNPDKQAVHLGRDVLSITTEAATDVDGTPAHRHVKPTAFRVTTVQFHGQKLHFMGFVNAQFPSILSTNHLFFMNAIGVVCGDLSIVSQSNSLFIIQDLIPWHSNAVETAIASHSRHMRGDPTVVYVESEFYQRCTNYGVYFPARYRAMKWPMMDDGKPTGEQTPAVDDLKAAPEE